MWELKAKLQVQALIRRAESAGAFVAVVASGDRDAGTILVQVNSLDGKAALYGQTRDEDFHRIWEVLLPPGTPETAVAELTMRRRRTDPDLWVVEIEDRQRRHFLSEKVLGPDPGKQ